MGSTHLFKLMGNLQKEDIKLHRSKVWDILEINWKKCYINSKWKHYLPGSVILPF